MGDVKRQGTVPSKYNITDAHANSQNGGNLQRVSNERASGHDLSFLTKKLSLTTIYKENFCFLQWSLIDYAYHLQKHFLCSPPETQSQLSGWRNIFFLLILCLLFFNLTGYSFVYIFGFSVLIQMGLLLCVCFVFLPFTLYMVFYFS